MAAKPVCSRIGDKVEIDVAVNFEEQLEQLELTVILGFLAHFFVSSCITKGIARSCIAKFQPIPLSHKIF